MAVIRHDKGLQINRPENLRFVSKTNILIIFTYYIQLIYFFFNKRF
jgi:hypothetical protein